jgi:hypothetical protein
MVKRDPTPRGIDRVPLWVKVGTGLAITASALSACGSSSADKAPTPAPTTSSADITPGTTPTAGATETTKDAFPASPDSITQGEVFSKLTPEQQAVISRIDAYANLADADKEPAENRALYAAVFLGTYRGSVVNNLEKTHTGEAGTLYGIFPYKPVSETNTPQDVAYQITQDDAVIFGALASDGDDSIVDPARKLAAKKAVGGLYVNPLDPVCVKFRELLDSTTEIKNAPGVFATDGYIPYGALPTSVPASVDKTGKVTMVLDLSNSLTNIDSRHPLTLVKTGAGSVWQNGTVTNINQ